MSSEKDMMRLQDAGGSEIERRLLASVADDAMPEEKYRALLRWSEGAVAAARATPSRPAWKLSLLNGLKGFGLLALAVASVGALVVTSSSSSSARKAPSEAPQTLATTAAIPPSDGALLNAAPPVDAIVPVVPDVPVLTPNQLPSAPTAAPRAHGPDVSLGEQMKFIDAARTRLRQDDASGALSVLDDYARRYSEPAFREEATVLRVSAHAKAGDVAEAKRLGGAFLNTHPAELYSRRVEAILRSLESREGAR